MKLCDLHTHSVFSDGTFTPEEIVAAAEAAGLSCVALCDHNTVDGLPRFLAAGAGTSLEVIASAEFSVDYQGTELHLLGLYLPESSFPQIQSLMQEFKDRKTRSNIALIESLNRAGYSINFETIRRGTPCGNINRAHIAAELKKQGYVRSVKEAFDTLLSPDAGYYKEPIRVSVWEMLDFLSSVGAVPVLAHPFLNLDEQSLRLFLPAAKERGLKAMECLYSLYDEQTTRKSFELADTFGLLYSGGSDFHGSNKPHIQLGTGRGNLAIPEEWVEEMKKITAE